MCWKQINVLLIVAVFVGMFAGCSATPTATKQETVVFATRVALTVVDAPPATANAAIAAVFAHFSDMHRRFHPWRNGELQRLNQAIAAEELPYTVSAPMAAMILQAQRYAAASEQLFNPAIGALVRLWGFHAEVLPTAPPAPAAIADWLAQQPNMAAVQLVGERVVAAPPAVQLDFGALAKGVALDEARAILLQHGVTNALIDIGGNIMALGTQHGRPWRVALAPDRSQPPLATVDLYDGEAVATSGDSVRYFIADGKRYHHILDPRSGSPAAQTTAAIVIVGGKDAGALSDATATALVIAEAALAERILQTLNITLAWQQGNKPTAAMLQRITKEE